MHQPLPVQVGQRVRHWQQHFPRFDGGERTFVQNLRQVLTGQPQVANGASDLLGKAFGEAGVHARSAVGVPVLPLDAPVEVEILVEV